MNGSGRKISANRWYRSLGSHLTLPGILCISAIWVLWNNPCSMWFGSPSCPPPLSRSFMSPSRSPRSVSTTCVPFICIVWSWRIKLRSLRRHSPIAKNMNRNRQLFWITKTGLEHDNWIKHLLYSALKFSAFRIWDLLIICHYICAISITLNHTRMNFRHCDQKFKQKTNVFK